MQRNTEDELYRVCLAILPVLCVLCLVMRMKGIVFTDVLPGCILRQWTGYYCPGCGATRALTLFMEGHFIKSLLYHPIVVYGAFVYGWFLVSQSVQRLTKQKLKIGMRYRPVWLYLSLVILILHCIIRNVLLIVTGSGMP